MPARPRKGARFGGSAAHPEGHDGQPCRQPHRSRGDHHHGSQGQGHASCGGEDDRKAKKGGVHNHRNVVKFLRDREMASKLFDEIGPRYEDRPVATSGSSSSILVRGTTRRWRVSSWSDLVRLQPVQNVDRSVPLRRGASPFRRMPERRRPGRRPSLTTWPPGPSPRRPMGGCASA